MAGPFVLYGIPNCDTVKKARTWLDEAALPYRFHDYKKAGIDAATLQAWCNEFGYEQVLNKKGTTWRQLDDASQANINQDKAIKLMQQHTSLIKRPMLDTGARRLLGFNLGDYQSLL
ncbi:MAG: ArsC family reductase [Pseudomonadota bacterium]